MPGRPAEALEPRVVRADNAGLFTLDGTRTYLVGREVVALIDPGPDDSRHLERLAREVEDARRVAILLTHGHPDHSAGAPGLALRLRERGLEVSIRGAAGEAESALAGGECVETDRGALVTVETPGHAAEHLAFHWEAARTVFVGDLLLGEGSTAWVGGYAGCVADYLTSLDRVEDLRARRILPAHGPPLEDPARDVQRFRDHRLRRLEQVRGLAADAQDPDVETIVREVYGPRLPEGLREAARWSVLAMLDHLGLGRFPEPGPETEGGAAS